MALGFLGVEEGCLTGIQWALKLNQSEDGMPPKAPKLLGKALEKYTAFCLLWQQSELVRRVFSLLFIFVACFFSLFSSRGTQNQLPWNLERKYFYPREGHGLILEGFEETGLEGRGGGFWYWGARGAHTQEPLFSTFY